MRAQGKADRASLEPAWAQPRLFGPVLLLASVVISGWFAMRQLPLPDEGQVLTAASKILRGGIFYRDIDVYPFPGASYLVALAMGVFGEHLTVARLLAGAVYCGIVLSLYLAALQILDRRRAALFGLSLLSFKVLSWPSFTIYIYADVAFLFACAAIALLLGHRFHGASLRLVLAGFCVGLAVACKQNVGIYLGAAVVAVLILPGVLLRRARERRADAAAEVLAFGGGVALALAPMLAYFAGHGLLGTMLYSGLVRPFTGYLTTSDIPFNVPLRWWELGALRVQDAAPYFVQQYWQLLMKHYLPGESWYPAYWLAGEIFTRIVYTSIVLGFVAVFGCWARAIRRREASARDSRVFLLAGLTFAVFLSAFPRADYFHVFGVYPLVVLLLFALSARWEARGGDRWRRSLRWFEGGVVASLLAVSAAIALTTASHLTYRVELDRADVYVFPDQAWIQPMVEQISSELEPGDPLFVYGHEAHWYFLTGHFYPWKFSQLYPGQAGGDGGRRLVALLKEVPPRTILRGLMKWPGVPGLRSYAPLLERHILRNYCREDGFFGARIPIGVERPPNWVFQVLRQGSEPAASAGEIRSCSQPTE